MVTLTNNDLHRCPTGIYIYDNKRPPIDPSTSSASGFVPPKRTNHMLGPHCTLYKLRGYL